MKSIMLTKELCKVKRVVKGAVRKVVLKLVPTRRGLALVKVSDSIEMDDVRPVISEEADPVESQLRIVEIKTEFSCMISKADK